MKVLIIGGVAGGATAAARLRRLDETAQIILLERSGYISYANCGLPYYIGGVITDEEDLTLQTPEGFWERFRIDVRIHQEAVAIDPVKKTVSIRDLQNGRSYSESYDRLILAPGAKSSKPDLPGISNDRIFTLRTVEDTLRIRRHLNENKPGSAVLVGGGYIGLEMAENLCEAGVKVTIVQRPEQVLNTLDYDMAALVHAKLRQAGVRILPGRDVVAFEDSGKSFSVVLKDGERLPTEMVLLAIGVTPETTLAQKAGLALGIKGSIVVNDRMETSVPDIYAVGDAVQVKHLVSGQESVIALAGPANKQGRIAADNICGLDSRYRGSLGSSIIKVFDLTVASTGLTEKAAEAAGIPCDRVVLSPSSHAGYYPGGSVMTMKVVFGKDSGKLLGAQIIGSDGVDKRIDVLAAAICAGLSATDLKDLDLAYAPPYSSAKDPVNMAGFMIENILTGKVKQFHWDEVGSLPQDGSVTLLDTRTPGEYIRGHAEGFINIPVDELRERLDELDPARPVYVMCQSGLRSYIACRILIQNGFDCRNFSGGYRFFSAVTKESSLCDQATPCGKEK